MTKKLTLLTLLLWVLAACQTQPTPTPSVSPSPTPAPTHDAFLPLTAGGGATPTHPLTPTTRPSATATVTPTATVPAFPFYDGTPIDRRDVGIQVHLHQEDQAFLFRHLQALDVGWVKVQVSWKLYEPDPGRYDDFRFDELDRFVSTAAANDIAVLLSVAKAPEWRRPTTEMDGPPGDPAGYETFMRFLAERYRGQVAAYELWNEPNLQREWNGAPLDPAGVVALIRRGAAGVRAVDEGAVLISGAPATTGINDGVTAIDDRVFLRGMVDAGVANVVDAVGVHPYGWANPPDASAADVAQTAPTHNGHPSFFFRDTLHDYHTILQEAGHGAVPLWVTEFGWGSFDGMGAQPPAGAEFMAHVSEWQQAVYTLRAYELAQEWEWVGPLFLWNLNFAPTLGTDFSESGYSVLRADGAPRPVYHALQTLYR